MKDIHILNLRRLLIHWKVYMTRTSSWLSVVNSGMIFFLVFDIQSKKLLIPIFIGTVVLLITLGYIDTNILKLFREESRITANNTPQLVEILQKLDKLEKLIKEKSHAKKID